MYKFLHTADIHLDSPLLNLDRYDGAPVEMFRSATRRAMDNLVHLAISEQVQFVLIAGDLYDGDCRDFNTPRHFRRKMQELDAEGIRVFICQGNHDAQSSMRKAFQLQLPDNVHLFSTQQPETVRIAELRAAIHGQGFAEPAIEHDLSEGYPPPLPGWLNIGLLHTSCGVYEAHDRYAPSSVAGLTRKGYQYWALGHIHRRENLAGPHPWIVYPGNLQGRHIREEGPKGCVLASVDDDDRITLQWQPLDVLRWQSCLVDAGSCGEPEQVLVEAQSSLEKLLAEAHDRPLAVRIEVLGATAAHRQLVRHADHWDRRLREVAVDRFDQRVWVEKIRFRTRMATAALERAEEDDPLLELIAGIRDSRAAQAALEEVETDFLQLLKQLPTDPRLSERLLDLDDSGTRESLLEDAQELLAGRLLEPGDEA